MLEPSQPSKLSRSIVKALLYSDIFQYPLTSKEIFGRLESNHVSQPDVDRALENLASQQLVFRFDDFFSVRNDGSLLERRKKGNALAENMMPKALRRARLIYRFPFVRAVMFSGSLSKNYADEKSDADFFIVTTPGRLWLTRVILFSFRKIFLFSSNKFFCTNYFIDEDHLTIEEQNQFTAVEMATLVPVFGFSVYKKLIEHNEWIYRYLPNFKPATESKGATTSFTPKQLMEAVLSILPVKRLESLLMKISVARWKHRNRHKISPADFPIAFKATPHVSKSHPFFYQKKVLDSYEKKIDTFFSQHRLP